MLNYRSFIYNYFCSIPGFLFVFRSILVDFRSMLVVSMQLRVKFKLSILCQFMFISSQFWYTYVNSSLFHVMHVLVVFTSFTNRFQVYFFIDFRSILVDFRSILVYLQMISCLFQVNSGRFHHIYNSTSGFSLSISGQFWSFSGQFWSIFKSILVYF